MSFDSFGKLPRIVGVGLLALFLLIPLQLIRSVVKERHQRYRGVVQEIARAWSPSQTLAGPVLIVPFSRRVPVRYRLIEAEGTTRSAKSGIRWEMHEERAVLLPDRLMIQGDVTPEERRRGIYTVHVYRAHTVLSGTFEDAAARVEALFPAKDLGEIHWDRATLVMGLKEPRGIVEVKPVRVGGADRTVLPGTGLDGALARGFHCEPGIAAGKRLEFSIDLSFRGSGTLGFLPLGAATEVKLSSPWPSPSFSGETLPERYQTGPQGFTGRWRVSELARSYPQQFLASTDVDLTQISGGVRLFEPVTLYDKVTRAVKYGILFIALTYLTLGLIELTTAARVSALQYLLVGAALALFFLLLIAFAEHLGFGPAYLLASATVVALNTLYCSALLPRRRLALAVGGVLTIIYAVLFTILRAEDYALLAGSLLLAVALAASMYVTRRANEEWTASPPADNRHSSGSEPVPPREPGAPAQGPVI